MICWYCGTRMDEYESRFTRGRIMTEDQVWVSAARIAATAEPHDPHARYELMQAIVDLVKNAELHH